VVRRTIAIGDPQSTAARFFAALARHGVLDDDGSLRPDVQLISLGDHFDYNPRVHPGCDQSGDGIRILTWLAAHPPSQVTIVFGNHDAARVMELSEATDERFAEAGQHVDEPVERWAQRFPELPAPILVAKDYQSFTVEQRALVERLLLENRFALAATATRDGRELLVTHAGVTMREVELLGLSSALPGGSAARPGEAGACVAATPSALARALQQRLARAVVEVAPRWRRGERAALDLAPIHVAGSKGRDDAAVREGGGLLYHRPADPRTARPQDGAAPFAPRRFHPDALPRGLTQLVGHSGDSRLRKALRRWLADDLPEHASVRTLVAGDDVAYRAGVHLADTAMILADPELNTTAIDAVDVVELDANSVRT
jgi:hypothetical protein